MRKGRADPRDSETAPTLETQRPHDPRASEAAPTLETQRPRRPSPPQIPQNSRQHVTAETLTAPTPPNPTDWQPDYFSEVSLLSSSGFVVMSGSSPCASLYLKRRIFWVAVFSKFCFTTSTEFTFDDFPTCLLT